MISPSYDAFNESMSTLKFATRAKKIKNVASINEDLDQAALIRKYEKELKKLRQELETRPEGQGTPLDQEVVQSLHAQKRQLEEDKQAAINALEARSREFAKEKEEKQQLLMRIRMLSQQVLVGGQQIEETP